MIPKLLRRLTILHSILLVLGGCASTPQSTGSRDGARGSARDGSEAQALVMDWADNYIASLNEAVYLLTRNEGHDPRSRWLAQSFLRNGVGASIDIAAGPNPGIAALDLLVLSSLQAWSFEVHYIPEGIGEGGGPALVRLREAEAEMWEKARSVLSDEQLRTVRQLVDAWIEQNPGRTVVALVRFDEFADDRKVSSLSLRGKATGLLREVSEASGAIDDARLFGERALWLSGRFLYLLGEQAELTTYRLADQPEIRQLLETLRAIEEASTLAATRLESLTQDLQVERVALFEQIAAERSRTIEHAQTALAATIAESIDESMDRITVERQAAVEQLFKFLGAERTLLLDDIEDRQDQLRSVMTDLQGTISSSGDLAHELTGTIDAIDRVVSRFDTEPDADREPLDMKDVRDAASEAKLAAQELTKLLEMTDQLVASEAWDLRVASIVAPANSVVNRAFRVGVMLIALLIVGLGVMLLVVGLILNRFIVRPRHEVSVA